MIKPNTLSHFFPLQLNFRRKESKCNFIFDETRKLIKLSRKREFIGEFFNNDDQMMFQALLSEKYDNFA